jgi:hypothetical protein
MGMGCTDGYPHMGSACGLLLWIWDMPWASCADVGGMPMVFYVPGGIFYC